MESFMDWVEGIEKVCGTELILEERNSKDSDKVKRNEFVAEKSTGPESYAFQYETEMKEEYLEDKSLQERYWARDD